MADDRVILAGIRPDGSIGTVNVDESSNTLTSLSTLLAGEDPVNGWLNVRQSSPPLMKMWTPVDLGVNGVTLGENRDTEWIDVRGYSRLYAMSRTSPVVSNGVCSIDMFGTFCLTADSQSWGSETDWFLYVAKRAVPAANGNPQHVTNAEPSAYANGGQYTNLMPGLAKVKLRISGSDSSHTGWLWMIGLP